MTTGPNIHYGYVGAAAGFSSWTLKSGAGYAQVKDRTVPVGYWSRRFKVIGDADFLAAFDDPQDQNSIELGVMLWENSGKNLTLNSFLKSVRKVAPQLKTTK